MELEVLQGSPQVQVIITSTDITRVITAFLGDSTSELLTVSTNKDMISPYGTFQLVFVPRKDRLNDTWFDKVQVFDFVEIKFKGIKDSELTTVMRGLVDSVTKSESWESGVPQRSITVAGRDLGCLMTDFQIYYLPELGLKQAVASELKILSWDIMKKKPNLITDADETFEILFSHWFEQLDLIVGITTEKPKTIQSYLAWTIETFWPNSKTNLFFLLSYEGPWWNAFSTYLDKPFHELFIYDDKDFSRLILRPSRLKDAKGGYPQPVRNVASTPLRASILYPPNWEVLDGEKVSITVEKDMSGLYTFYFSEPTLTLFTKEDFRVLCWDKNRDNPAQSLNPYLALNPSMPSYIHKHGFRKYEAQTVFFDIDMGQKRSKGKDYVTGVLLPNFLERGKLMTQTMVAWFLHSPLLLSGSMVIPGTNRAIIGTYVHDVGDKMEYYVTGVSHEFSLFRTFRTTVTLERGLPDGGLPNSNPIVFDDSFSEV